MDSVPIDIPGTPGDGDDIDSPFSKASIKSRFKGISWSSFRKASKAKRPAVLQEVSPTAQLCLKLVNLIL